ncbi:MAG: branched-chain amino acid ABC transporter permease [Thermodesulfobacteriota bacterium]|nr:branched-chain amino acid ABC transporter permease [Thermodesulfobacteriota bacterium]
MTDMRPGGYHDTTYKQTLAILYTPWQWLSWICFLIFLVIIPFFSSPYVLTMLIRIGITIIAVVGLNIIVGNTGQLNIAQTALMAVGAYCSALLMGKTGLNFFPALLAAGLAGAVVGLAIGAPSLRIKGFYVALATLAGHFIIIWALMEWFGGTTGHPAPRPRIFGFNFRSDHNYYYLVLVFTISMSLFARNLFRSRIGRALVAIRDHDIAAEILGINIYRFKLLAFSVGSFYAGIAGCLQGHFCSYTNIEAFPFDDSIWLLGMVIVGGMGSVLGSVFGVVFFVLLEEITTLLGPVINTLFPSQFHLQAAMKYSVFSLLIILFVIFEPNGMAHRWNLIKSSFRVYPFSY